jgi:hypothetical protein
MIRRKRRLVRTDQKNGDARKLPIKKFWNGEKKFHLFFQFLKPRKLSAIKTTFNTTPARIPARVFTTIHKTFAIKYITNPIRFLLPRKYTDNNEKVIAKKSSPKYV